LKEGESKKSKKYLKAGGSKKKVRSISKQKEVERSKKYLK
jgi:hypothetical protein